MSCRVNSRKLSSFISLSGRRSPFQQFLQQLHIKSSTDQGLMGRDVPSHTSKRSRRCFLERFLADCKSGKIDICDAYFFFDYMLRKTPSLPISCFSTLLGALVKCKHFFVAISFYKTLDILGAMGTRSNLIILNILLNCYSRMRLSGAAFSVVGLVLKNGYRPSIATYNSLFKGLFLEDKAVEALDLFSKMIRLGSAPNIVAYNTVIDGLCKTGNATKALELHREMVYDKVGTTKQNSKSETVCYSLNDGRHIEWLTSDTKISPDVVSYSSLIDGLWRLGKEDEALFLLVEMIEREIHPNVVTFGIIINSLCKKGKVEQIVEVLEAMRLRGVFPNTITYNMLIDGWCRIGKPEEGLRLYKDMDCRGMFADNVTINPLLKVLFQMEKVEDAICLFSNMKRMEANGVCGPDQVTYATVIDGLCKQGHIDVAEELLVEMQGNSLSVDIFVYGSLIDGLCKQAKIVKAKKLLSEMISSGVSPNVVVYNSLINGLCKQGHLEEAKEVFWQMQCSGISPDIISYNSLIDGMYLFGNEMGAKTVLAKMIVDGILPNVVTFSILEKWQFFLRETSNKQLKWDLKA